MSASLQSETIDFQDETHTKNIGFHIEEDEVKG